MAQNKGTFDHTDDTMRMGANSAIKAVTTTVTLEPHERFVHADCSTTYVITLPALATCPWADFIIVATVGGGSVTIDDQEDGIKDVFWQGGTADQMTTAKDYIHVRNLGGVVWAVTAEVTT